MSWANGRNYIAWIITVLGAINSNLTFIFDVNYFLWKFKTSKRQGHGRSQDFSKGGSH